MTSGEIRTPDQRLRVFVSSTLGELAAERQAARAAIEQLRLTPVLFELGARPHPPRALYRSYLEQSDVFVGIYWQRYGWVAPDMEISGLEDEYQLSAGMPRLVYVKRPAPDMEPRLEALLDHLREEDSTSYRSFASAVELEQLLVDDLAVMLTERFDASEPGADRRPSVGPSNLPRPTSSLVGREEVLGELFDLLQRDDARLVTLTGAGGTGKTRLATELAARCVDCFADGVFFVDLSAARDPAAVYAAIARTVIADGAGDDPPLDAVGDALRDRNVLLVLDNFEQVLDAASGVVQLLQHCPELTVLATSREALRVRGEQLFRVPPLSVPDDTARTLAVEDALTSSAVRLFVDRARATAPDLVVLPGNVDDIAAICRRLDGLPLAIELAAARMNLFSVDELRQRLETRLDVLEGGPRDLPERQQTLRRAIEWSIDLLTDSERRVLELFAAFEGARLADVDAVAARLPALGGVDVIEAMGSLIDKSLLRGVRGLDGRPRFSMLRTIRDYATEQLDASVELAGSVRRVVAEHYTARAVDLHAALHETNRSDAFSEMEDELANLRAAWDHWLAHGVVDRLHELLDPLWSFHEARGDYGAAIGLGDELLGVLRGLPATPERAQAEYDMHLNLARAVVAARGFTHDAERRMRAALEQHEAGSDDRRRFTTLRSLAALHITRTDFDSATEVARELLALAEERQDPTMLSEAHLVAGTVSIWSEGWRAALAHMEEAIRGFSATPPTPRQFRIGPHPEVVSHAVSALVHWKMGRPERADTERARARELAIELDHPYSSAYAEFHAALLDVWRTDLPSTGSRAEELIRLADAHDFAIWRALGIVLRGVAMVGGGELDAGLDEVARGFSLYGDLSTPPVFWPALLLIRSQACAMAGRIEEAGAHLHQAEAGTAADDPLAPDLAIARADLVLALPSPDIAAADALLEKAMSLAAADASRMTELQAATRLLEVRRGSEREGESRRRLHEVLDTFADGFDAPPIVVARSALDRG